MSDNLVCLTFDDGPSAFRPQTLQILRDLEVPAVFFEVGMRVRANPQLTRFAADEGHQVLNHSYTHSALSSLSAARVRGEIWRTEDAFTDAGVTVPFDGLRPPMTAIDDAARRVLAELGYAEVEYDASVRDWHPEATVEEIRDAMLGGLAPGAVLLLHDGPADTGAGAATLEALPQIIAGARDRGFEFGLLDADLQVVEATYVSSGKPIPQIQAPVPYRPLMFTDPEPPDNWFPALDGPRSSRAVMRRYLQEFRDGEDTDDGWDPLTGDVLWVVEDTGERLRGREAVRPAIRALCARMTDVVTRTYVVTDDVALIEGDCRARPVSGPATSGPQERIPFAAVHEIAVDGIAAIRLHMAVSRLSPPS